MAAASFCSDQHFCSCPPFLRYSSISTEPGLHFTKHNYADQYAIVGKSKELHCCVGPGYDTLEWYKDDAQFPWETTQGEERNAIIYSNNQSLIMMEVRPGDSGQYKCVARSSTGHVLHHTTMLTSFPAPVFAHPPIWNARPGNVRVVRGAKAVLDCSATVGQQYNTVSMEPVHAAWTRFGREMEDGPGTLVSQEWTDDDIVIHLRLEIMSAQEADKGEYCCRVKNQYGVLEKKVVLEVEDIDEEYGEEEKSLEMKRELHGLFRKQMKIYSALARVVTADQDLFHQVLHQAEKKLN
eukprot:TRINITY_DN16272_c0_g1_i4.p1 TRINITY_DN16272_c0_g1~~TRINITY_DN16272_c0_g1_i4.p1  ORF type:complete len:321 (-),score=111.77 TRINITY_DN16272_c0_g1_i4:65-949(-)